MTGRLLITLTNWVPTFYWHPQSQHCLGYHTFRPHSNRSFSLFYCTTQQWNIVHIVISLLSSVPHARIDIRFSKNWLLKHQTDTFNFKLMWKLNSSQAGYCLNVARSFLRYTKFTEIGCYRIFAIITSIN